MMNESTASEAMPMRRGDTRLSKRSHPRQFNSHTSCFVILVPILLSSGCWPRVWTDFEPYSIAESGQPRLVEAAQRVREGDIPYLAQAGGFVVGTVYARGNKWARRRRLHRKAAEKAANFGATHIIEATRWQHVDYVEWGQDRTEIQRTSQDTYTATHHPRHRVKIRKNRGGYVAIRVPKDRWPQLPRKLHPVLAGGS